MDIIKMDATSGEFELRCPYCNEVIHAESDDVIIGSCEHLIFTYTNDENEFIDATDVIRQMHKDAGGESEDGLPFDEFIEVLKANPDTENSTGVLLIDTYDSVWFWFKP